MSDYQIDIGGIDVTAAKQSCMGSISVSGGWSAYPLPLEKKISQGFITVTAMPSVSSSAERQSPATNPVAPYGHMLSVDLNAPPPQAWGPCCFELEAGVYQVVVCMYVDGKLVASYGPSTATVPYSQM